MPTDAAMAFNTMPQSFQDRLAGLTLPNANDQSLDPDANGFLNPSSAAVVDWVLVQARVVADGSGPPSAPAYCDSNDCVTQAGLLMADGAVLGVDDNGALVEEGEFIFEDLEYDPDSQDLYIAIQHRNHVAILSSSGAASGAAQNDVYVYDFTDPSNVFEGVNSVTAGLGLLPPGQVAMRGGDADPSNLVNITDLSAVAASFGRASPYFLIDTNMNGLVEINDLSLVAARFGRGALFTFF